MYYKLIVIASVMSVSTAVILNSIKKGEKYTKLKQILTILFLLVLFVLIAFFVESENL